MRSHEAPLPNYAVNPAHSAVTACAYCSTRRARGRAGYRERYTHLIDICGGRK